MKSIRNLAAGLLVLTGTLHLVSAAISKYEVTSIITIIFGTAYLIIGYLMFRNGRIALWFGAIVPLMGLLLAVLGMLLKPTLLGAIFIAIDIIVTASCFWLLFHSEGDLTGNKFKKTEQY